jgi:cytochrome P450
MEPVRALALDEIDLNELDFWLRPMEEREGAFLTLREEDPIHFQEEPEPANEMFTRGPGYYSLTRHEHILEASKNPKLFCSGRGTNIVDLPEPFLEFFGSMINMDDPKHARMRRIVSRGFTPKMLDSMKAGVEEAAADVVDAIIDKGECDFVTEVAALLPLRIIVDLMGIPRSEEKAIFEQSNVVLGFMDPEYVPPGPDGVADPTVVTGALLNAGQQLANLVRELGEDRVKDPRDDLTTALVTAEVDGEMLTPEELGSFFILLVVAGNETTRNAIAHGLHALTEHPDQQQRWRDDYDGLAPTAVEEIVRWATPVIHFRRTVTEDGARIGDQVFSKGDKVVLWYNSGNRDERVIEDPFRFDISRTPNEHVGFGGPGPHFCLGAHLARREITVMFRELLTRIPDIHAVEPPDKLRSNFIHGIKHLRAEFTAGGAR